MILPDEREVLTEQEAARALNCPLSRLRADRKRGLLDYYRIGRQVRHSGRHLMEYLERCETTGPASHPMGSTGSANDPAPTSGAGPGSIPLSAKRAELASAQQTFAPPTKHSRSGGQKTAA